MGRAVEILVFRAGAMTLGADARQIQSILSRGQVSHAVADTTDLRERFGPAWPVCGSASPRALVISDASGPHAIRVDEILDVFSAETQSLRRLPAALEESPAQHRLCGVLLKGDDLIPLVDLVNSNR